MCLSLDLSLEVPAPANRLLRQSPPTGTNLRPNALWLTDTLPVPGPGGAPTEHPTGEGKLYLCAVKDTCTNRIVAYSIDDRMSSQLAVAALANAVALRRPAGTVVPSDSQFRFNAYVHALRSAGLHGSMGRAGACADDAATESHFSLPQKSILAGNQWTSRQDLRLAIVVWDELGPGSCSGADLNHSPQCRFPP